LVSNPIIRPAYPSESFAAAPRDRRLHRLDRYGFALPAEHALHRRHRCGGGDDLVTPGRDLDELDAVAGLEAARVPHGGWNGDLALARRRRHASLLRPHCLTLK
jgi:hypothetical protein